MKKHLILLVGLLSISLSTIAQDTTKTSVQEIAESYLRDFYDLNYQRLRTYYTEESYWYDPSTKLIVPNVTKSVGPDRIIKDLTNGFNGVFDAKYDIEKIFVSGPFVSVWGTYSYKIGAKYFQGLAGYSDTFEFSIAMSTNLVIQNGQVLEHLEHGDWMSWAMQAKEQANALLKKN